MSRLNRLRTFYRRRLSCTPVEELRKRWKNKDEDRCVQG